MFSKSISVNYFRHMKASYKKALAPNKVLNQRQVNRDSPSGEDSQALRGMEMSLAFSHLCSNHSFHCFWRHPRAGGQLKLFSLKHTPLPKPKNACVVSLPRCKHGSNTTYRRRSDFTKTSKKTMGGSHLNKQKMT